ncbi:MAG: dTDP-4-dehydrorhamnose reductase [Nitrospinales bacterium]
MIAIIGSNGQLGWELVRKAENRGYEVLPLDFPEIDIAQPATIKNKLSLKNLSLVVNAAAYTAVDQAESEPDLVYSVNRDGAANLADFCAQASLPFIHVSTDYVFDGSKTGPYYEDDPVAPLGVYGQSKEAGESEVRRRLRKHLIIRTAWLCGVHGHNFVKTMLRLGKERDIIKVVGDQTGCPTYAADLADAILLMTDHILSGKKIPWGTYHFCGGGSTTWHGFAEAILKIAKKYEAFSVQEVIPITSDEYPTPVKRPTNSVLDCSKIEKNFGICPRPWIKSLTDMIDALYVRE